MAQKNLLEPHDDPLPSGVRAEPSAARDMPPARETTLGGTSVLPPPGLEPPPPTTAPRAEALRLPSAARAGEPSAHAAFLARRHFASLDGLRALGILAVVWHHTLGGPGRFGANLFFLLSGFLVTTILLRERAKRNTIDVARFRARRARRLYPLYYSVLLGYVVLVWLVEPAGTARSAFFAHLPAYATFTSNLFVELDGEHVIFYFAWSLAAQEQFYLLWPWLVRRARTWICGLSLCALAGAAYLARAGVLDPTPSGSGFMRTLVLALMPALLLGALLAILLNVRRGFEALQAFLGSRWASCAALAVALTLWRTRSGPELLVHLALTALVAACVLREDHLLARFLCHPVLVHVGTVSYGVYLLHMLCHNAVERVLARLGLGFALLDFVLTALLAVLVATLSHRHFERRFLPADKRLARA
jgi:peptidoglycan/LPS O-acetylase OafA/YrhL